MRKQLLIVALCIARIARADTRLKPIEEAGPLTDKERASRLQLASLCDANGKALSRFAPGGETCGKDCQDRIEAECKAEKAIAPPDITGVPSPSTMSWQANALNGFSGFIAQRSKAEVINWAESLISKHLCGMTSPPSPPGTEREKWFHDTCVLLDDPQLALQMSTAMIAASVRSDLVRVPRAIARWFAEHESAKLGPAKIQRITHDVETAERMYEGLRRGAAPLELIAGLGHDGDLRAECVAGSLRTPDRVTPECALVLAAIVVEHFGAAITGANLPAIDLKHFEQMFTTVFAGSSMCLALNEAFGVGSPAVAVIPGPADALPPCTLASTIPKALRRYVTLLNLPSNDVDYKSYKARLRRLVQAMVEFEVLVRDVKKTVDVQALVKDAGTLTITDSGLTRVADSFIAVIRSGLGLFDNKEGVEGYEASFENVLEIARLGTRIAAGDYMGTGAALVNLAAADHLGIAFPESFKRILAFTIDVASAKSSDDVQHAIELAAAPVGGWKLKREHWSVSLTAFAGAMGGQEWTTRSALKDGEPKPGGGHAGGLFAPVGLDLAGPLCKSLNAGIFLSILDVGQLTWSRLTNVSDTDSTASITPNVDFAQVVSPGAYVHFGLGNSPFVIGAGVSFAPALRNYTIGMAGTATSAPFDVIRFGVFLAVDVTILPLWTAN